MKKATLALACALQAFVVLAQKQAPENWFNLDPKKDKVNGVSTERAYNELLKGKTSQTVVVAVIDGGTEVDHEDLKEVIWINSREIPGNGIDDDQNGYVDDVHGWNFIGGKEKNIDQDNLEVTRMYRKLKARYEKIDTTTLEGEERDHYALYQKVKAVYLKNSSEYLLYNLGYAALEKGVKGLADKAGKDSMSIEEFSALSPSGPQETNASKAILSYTKATKQKYVVISHFARELEGGREQIKTFVEYHYNLDFDPREEIVGDNYENTNERYYGNNRVSEPNGEHGSHVAGIIAAVRNNNIGMRGVADNARIMVLRVVPDGDERDKDVANAIRYAADNGAKVINMSFGKAFSPYKPAVDEAIKYAQTKDVLLVHAAGNDNKNTDVESNFPCDKADGYNADNWLEVGASSWMKKKDIPAPFSNYASSNVDVFAPGVDIYSTIPHSKYASYDGTSMASPVTAGVAAVIRSYYPQLTAAEVKTIIMESAIKVKGKVNRPGSKTKVSMDELCRTGGIVNLYEALLLAETRSKK